MDTLADSNQATDRHGQPQYQLAAAAKPQRRIPLAILLRRVGSHRSSGLSTRLCLLVGLVSGLLANTGCQTSSAPAASAGPPMHNRPANPPPALPGPERVDDAQFPRMSPDQTSPTQTFQSSPSPRPADELSNVLSTPPTPLPPAAADTPADTPSTPVLATTPIAPPADAGATRHITEPALLELSGLAASQRNLYRLWALNDGGHPAALYALSTGGASLQRFAVAARNQDWEALASFRLAHQPWLLIADTGDNRRRRQHARLLFFVEPTLAADRSNAGAAASASGSGPVMSTADAAQLEPELTIEFGFEDGPQDVEAIAVSVADGQIILISKSSPAGIYQLPLPPLAEFLRTGAAAVLTSQLATRSGTLPDLPGAAALRWLSALAKTNLAAVTALDFDEPRRTGWLLGYQGVYRIEKGTADTWAMALSSGKVTQQQQHELQQAEAMAVTNDGSVWVTSEGRRPPLLQLRDQLPN